MADLTIDALTAVGEASKFSVRVELTDNRSNPIIGFVDDQIIVSAFTTETDDEGHTTLTLIPNADIEPANSCYTVTVGTKSFLIQKTSETQTLQDALVDSPGPLAPFGMFLLKAANLGDLLNSTVARANLGLGDAAVLDVGTTPGTVAAGDDPRFETGGVSSHPELTERDDPNQHPAASIAFTPTGTQFTADDVQELGGQIDAALDALSTGFDALAIDVAAKAEDGEVVKLTGDQDVAGVKSFVDPTQFIANSNSTIPFDRELDFVLQNTDSTDGNYMTIGLYTADGTIAGGVAAQTLDHDAHTGRWAFSTRDASGFSAKLTIDDAVHVPDATGNDHALNRQTGDARYALDTDFDALAVDVDTIETNLNDLGVLVAGLDGDIGDLDADLSAHINDTTDAHDASAISFSPTGDVAATDVQAAIEELDDEKLALAGGRMSGVIEYREAQPAGVSVLFSAAATTSAIHTVAANTRGFYTFLDTQLSGNSANNILGEQLVARVNPSGFTHSNQVCGADVGGRVLGSGSTATCVGGRFQALVSGTVTVTTAIGGEFSVRDTDSATITTAMAGRFIYTHSGSTSPGTLYGILVESMTAGTASYGVAVQAAGTSTLWLSQDTNSTNAAGGISFGSSRDTNLYRNGADSLRTDDKFTANLGFQANSGNYRLNGSTGPLWTAGSGDPEGSVTAPVGSIYSRTDGGALTSFYVKESGTGNSGWVAK